MKRMKCIVFINKVLLRLIFFLSNDYSIGYSVIHVKVKLITESISNRLLDSDRAMMEIE